MVRFILLLLLCVSRVLAAKVPLREKQPDFQLLFNASKTANFFYTLDNLAGSSGSHRAISDMYRQSWAKEVGFTPDDDKYLANFLILRRESRKKRERPAIHRPLRASLAPPSMTAQELFATCFLKGTSLKQALALLKSLCNKDDKHVKRVERVFDHFAKRFDVLWEKKRGKLEKLAKEFSQRALVSKVAPFLDEVAAFYRSKVNDKTIFVNMMWAPSRVAHAATYGNHMIIPLPDGNDWNDDFVISRLGVIVHESSHYLFGSMAEELKSRITTEFVEKCGLLRNKHINILDEAVQTALGNALFLSRNFPESFDPKGFWYAFESQYDFPFAIDEFAKKLFGPLERALSAGETFYPTFFRNAMTIYDDTFPLRPKDFCKVSFLIGNDEVVDLFNMTLTSQSRWSYGLDKLEVARKDLMECPGRTVVLLLLQDELTRLKECNFPGISTQELEPILQKYPAALLTNKREERGYVFLFLARDLWELRKLLIRFYSFETIPEQPVYGR